MKKVFVFITALIFLAGCSQINQLKALQNCSYQITSVDSVFLANTDVSRMVSKNGLDLSQAPAIAFAVLSKNVPLSARLNFKIKNPGKTDAGINRFDYIVSLKDKELTSGSFNQKITVPANGGELTVPVAISSNVYPFLADAASRNAVINFLSTDSLQTTTITLKVKPSLVVGEKVVQYPGYISIDKEVTNQQLLAYLQRQE